jgi:Ca2+:H+ antiporter
VHIIGICVDELSHQLGLVLGSILNSIFLTFVELILYYFSLEKGDLADGVRSAVSGVFLMNLLIIPGFAMLAVSLKWNEVVLNKKS